MSAVRASPHSLTASAWTMPAPGVAPNDASAARDNRVPSNALAGIQLP